MDHQTVTQWTRREWGLYAEQVRDSISEPEISIHSSMRTALPLVTFVCPFCLHVGSGIDVVAPEGADSLESADSFTATWRDCGHAVQVVSPDVVGGPA